MLKDILFGLIGGLGLFLFGMKLMSEGLRKVAGDRLRKILRLLTKNPLIGVLVGTGVTCLIQSSSATTVMVVGLVNAGLLTLRQAIGVVMGANIGTTFTAWLVGFIGAFKITMYALPAIGIGFVLTTLGKTKRLKFWGQVLLGFGILFLGLGIMKEAFTPLKDSPTLKNVFEQFSRHPLLGVLVGVVFTMLLQSSSATIATVQILAFQGIISFNAAIPLILGDNIGTTITAQIASIGTGRSARRTAMAHTLFNVIGVAYMLPLVWVGIYAKAVEFLIPGPITTHNIMISIAVAHSAFNIFNTLVFLPMVGVLEKITSKIIPGEVEEIAAEPKYLERHLLDTPPVAIEQATKEIVRMIGIGRDAVSNAMSGFFSRNPKLLEKVSPKEEAIDNLQKEITKYLVELSQRSLTGDESEKLPALLHSVNDVERIGDHAENLVELADRAIDEKLPFSAYAMGELKDMYGEVDTMIAEVTKALEASDRRIAAKALEREETLNRFQIELRQNHIQRLNNGTCFILSGVIFLDMVNNLEKIGDHLTNIAQAVLGSFQWDDIKRYKGRGKSVASVTLLDSE